MRRWFTFIRIWFWLVILETWSLVQDANDALSRIKVSGATPAAECNDVEGTMRYPSLVDEYIPHSSDSLSVSHLLNSSSLSTLFFYFLQCSMLVHAVPLIVHACWNIRSIFIFFCFPLCSFIFIVFPFVRKGMRVSD